MPNYDYREILRQFEYDTSIKSYNSSPMVNKLRRAIKDGLLGDRNLKR